MNTRPALPVLLVLFVSLAHSLHSAPTPAPEGYEWVPDMRFTDEFNGDSLDLGKWYDHHPRWRGRPPAKFMPSAVSVKGGKLQIRNGVLDPPEGPFHIAGGAVVSKSVDAHFGYYEVKMKASQISMSSTFWFSNEAKRYGDLSISQELDVQEAVGAGKRHPDRKHFLKSNTHVWVRQDGKRITRSVPGDARISPPAGEAFHVYGVWWVDANTAHFYHNDEYKFTLRPNTEYHATPFERPMHLNLVTETYDWESPPTPEELANDQINTTYYDWVRAYRLVRKEDLSASPKQQSPASAASEELDRTARTIAAGPYRAEWESLKNHLDPEWFRDSKFGIYTHWGPVTVGAEDGPGGVQWYGKNMYETNSPTFGYHFEKYGDQEQVGYKDMIPKFTADRFDAEDWADLFAKSGARFAGPVAVHHDNFAMWDSRVTRWNSEGMGPQRDITGELRGAIRARGLRFTAKDDLLYAIVLGWPTNSELTVRSLASFAGRITRVTLVGQGDELEWEQTESGLKVVLPKEAPNAHAFVLRVLGTDLKPAPVPEADSALQPASNGSLLLRQPLGTTTRHSLWVGRRSRPAPTSSSISAPATPMLGGQSTSGRYNCTMSTSKPGHGHARSLY